MGVERRSLREPRASCASHHKAHSARARSRASTAVREVCHSTCARMQDKLQSCVKDEEERQQRLAVDRKVHSGVLDDIERLPAAPPGVDPAAEAALRVRPRASSSCTGL